jgi:Ca2+-binding EF-hand superfamily protein
MKGNLQKSQLQQQDSSKVFSKQEVEVFRRIFEKLAKGTPTINIQAYVSHIKELTKNKEEGVISMIVRDLEDEGDLQVNFKEFLAKMEEKVGDLNTSSGLQRIFNFITRDPIKKRVTLEDLQRIRSELGLGVSDKELQRLVNFVTASYKERSDFSFEEFERYALKEGGK